jgi:uncharacterized protein
VSARPLVLLPPSKGKSDDGEGPRYRSTLRRAHPLKTARRTVLDAVTAAAPDLDDAAVARIAGVRRSHVDDGRMRLVELGDLPTQPAHRRYTGIVHGNAGLAALDPATLDVDVVIVSALLGLVALDEPVPSYRLEFPASVAPLGGLATYWRDAAAETLAAITEDRPVWDLLPGEHARVWPRGLAGERDHRGVRFVRPDGRAANAARTKVAKGRLAGWLITAAGPGVTSDEVAAEADLGAGWMLAAEGSGLVATDGA